MSGTNPTINSNPDEVDQQSSSLFGASQYFSPNILLLKDDLTTIAVNSNSKNAFGYSQYLTSQFGTCLATDAENIRNLHLEFSEYDQMITDLLAYGYRCPVITAGGGDN